MEQERFEHPMLGKRSHLQVGLPDAAITAVLPLSISGIQLVGFKLLFEMKKLLALFALNGV
jgi:hypothetical protein